MFDTVGKKKVNTVLLNAVSKNGRVRIREQVFATANFCRSRILKKRNERDAAYILSLPSPDESARAMFAIVRFSAARERAAGKLRKSVLDFSQSEKRAVASEGEYVCGEVNSDRESRFSRTGDLLRASSVNTSGRSETERDEDDLDRMIDGLLQLRGLNVYEREEKRF